MERTSRVYKDQHCFFRHTVEPYYEYTIATDVQLTYMHYWRAGASQPNRTTGAIFLYNILGECWTLLASGSEARY